jgi:hypothetical protein
MVSPIVARWHYFDKLDFGLCDYLPFEDELTLHFNKLIFFFYSSVTCNNASLIEIGRLVQEKILKIFPTINKCKNGFPFCCPC